jgi:hypothetical protein
MQTASVVHEIRDRDLVAVGQGWEKGTQLRIRFYFVFVNELKDHYGCKHFGDGTYMVQGVRICLSVFFNIGITDAVGICNLSVFRYTHTQHTFLMSIQGIAQLIEFSRVYLSEQ